MTLVWKRISVFLCMMALVAAPAFVAQAATVQLTGGGTNVVGDAITAATDGDVIEITDSLEYVEEGYANYIQVYRDVSIVASSGQTPTLTINQNYGFHVRGTNYFQLGSNSGGRITFDATAMGHGMLYIYQGTADVTMENLEILGGSGSYGPYVWGRNSAKTVTIDDCTFNDFGIHVLYNRGDKADGTEYQYVFNVTNCTFNDCADVYIRGGFTRSASDAINLTNCDFNGMGGMGGDSPGVAARQGKITLTECRLSDVGPDGSVQISVSEDGILELYNSALYNDVQSAEGDTLIQVSFLDSAFENGGVVMIDHCDLIADAGTAISVGPDARGSVVVANTNIICATGFVSNTTSTATLSSNYNNVFTSVVDYDGGVWAAGANDISFDPQYVSLFDDLTVDSVDVAAGDDAGEPIGSGLGGVVAVDRWELY